MPGSGTIWASLPIPALVLDPEDRITAINPAGELFFNKTIKALEGSLVYDRLAIDAPVEEALARVRKNRSPLFINDVDVGTGEKAPVICNVQVAPISNDTERLLFLVSPREIAGRLGRSISADKAAKSAIGMAEMLAHEIKNPLAGITGAAQLLSMSLSKEDLELTDLIVAESRRIVKLLDQVEQFGNLRPPTLKPVNIHDVLDRARKSAVLSFAAHMKIVEDYDPSLPPTFADSDQLLQIFQNLLKNAAQASAGAPGEIQLRTFYDASLRVRRKGQSTSRVPLQIEIIDDGPGLKPEIADEIFEPFVSGRENGTGLGLALVSKIIAEHKGWISVDSVPGRTVFRISLPVAPKQTAEQLDEET
ncbi:two-component system sensor histidine kinase NtrB [Aliiruegeria sabulilitoris]|uniref:two-component system sensor histidine kinase NtrB n=1 Tax=Aliiruegeria sabulilitoris TaxID=1510458 RepID=UPI0008323BD7|nr:ATP-binding protein [Aliiruegeria sabulilitoris]NDR58293.1 PAS domain-containing sensor histidine kinase [Pseudoruegeria sp. M32A2M]